VAVERLSHGGPAPDEVLQRTRIKLLVGAPPLVGSYAGAGPLATWVRASAVRIALDMREQSERFVDAGALDTARMVGGLQGAPHGAEPVRAQLEAALRRALAELSPDDRSLLGMHLLDGLDVTELAARLHVLHATAGRRLLAIRNVVLEETRREMALPGATPPASFRALWRAFGDEVRLALARSLRAAERHV
jgi:RNA polymerase sigma-70 factor (ECF subfamily)